MKIQKITYNNFNLLKKESTNNNKKESIKTNNLNNMSFPYYNDLTFQARVDKNLVRFYEVNKNKMPKTVKNYIENLADKTIVTPLQAQAEAFLALAGVTSIVAIQTAFPEEKDLFENLKNPSETKATRGILGVYRQDKELLEIENRDMLSSKENLTVWLVKKIFLEGKTIDEINKDFEKEADPEFLLLYKSKEKDGQPIRTSTLKALGIQSPNSEYMQSLRFTREGYSDMVGERISQGLKDFMDSLTPEQRTERARGTVLKFIKHWESIPLDKKLDMLLEQEREIELLEMFKSYKAEKSSSIKDKISTQNKTTNDKQINNKKEHIKTDLTYDDELFSLWAKNNFAKFEMSLSEEEQKLLNIKRYQKRVEAWASMTPEEKTEYISKMKAGAEPLRFALIDAWNKNPDILIKLSIFLRKRNFERPEEFIFRSVEYNNYQSEIMSEFWATNPDFAKRWGEAIKESHFKVKSAIQDETFEDLKQLIMRDKNERSNLIKNKISCYKDILSTEEYSKYPEHVKDFIDTYIETNSAIVKTLPIDFLKDFFNATTYELNEDIVRSWEKAIRKELLTESDVKNIQFIKDLASPQTERMNRAFEVAVADMLYKATQNPIVYRIPASDCKLLLSKIQYGDQKINFVFNDDTTETIIIKKQDLDLKALNNSYKFYRKDHNNIDEIIMKYYLNYLNIENPLQWDEALEEIETYLGTYGNSLDIIFKNSNNLSPKTRAVYMAKMISFAPDHIAKLLRKGLLITENDFKKDDTIKSIINSIKKRYSFIPNHIFQAYSNGLSTLLAEGDLASLEKIQKIVDSNTSFSSQNIGHSQLLTFPRSALSMKDKLSILCAEQALSDILYKATMDPQVYLLTFEEMIDAINNFLYFKKADNQKQIVQSTVLNDNIVLTLKQKINLFQLEKNVAQYKENILEYLNEIDFKKDKLDYEEILFCLNTDEEKSFLDQYINKRINFTFTKNQ